MWFAQRVSCSDLICICARNRLRCSLDTSVQSHWLEIDTVMFTWLFSVKAIASSRGGSMWSMLLTAAELEVSCFSFISVQIFPHVEFYGHGILTWL